MSPLRIAIIGCGKIADQHVAAIARIRDCEIVAVCDSEKLMAAQLAERFSIGGVFSDAEEMLATISPEVVHITTPPQAHFALAKTCLQSGSNVYLEKPFTVTATEAEEIIDLANKHDLKVTAGHNYQFTSEMIAMRRLVGNGFLGGQPIHLESSWAYDLGDASYVAPILGSKTHWVRKLPGQLFHNLISHGIAKLAEFLHGKVEIVAHASQSAQLKDLGGGEVQDELRVFLHDESGTTAFFCFSTQIKPGRNYLQLCGPKSSLFVDQNSGSLLRLRSASDKSYLTYFLPPLRAARENVKNSFANAASFLRRTLYQDFGLKALTEGFYNSIRYQKPLPIPYREIIQTARIMDEIFAQVYPARVLNPVPDSSVETLLQAK